MRLVTLIVLGTCGLTFVANAQSVRRAPTPHKAVHRSTPASHRAIVRVVEVPRGTLRVRILAHDTRKPVANRSVVLRRAGKPNVIAKRTTAADGTCQLPVAGTGDYSLDFAGGTSLPLRVAKEASARRLDIVLPAQTKRLEPQASGAAPAGGAGAGLGTVGWGLIGVGVATVVVVPIVVASNNNNSTNRVSPTSARSR